MSSGELALVATDDLIAELMRRHDTAVFAGVLDRGERGGGEQGRVTRVGSDEDVVELAELIATEVGRDIDGEEE